MPRRNPRAPACPCIASPAPPKAIVIAIQQGRGAWTSGPTSEDLADQRDRERYIKKADIQTAPARRPRKASRPSTRSRKPRAWAAPGDQPADCAAPLLGLLQFERAPSAITAAINGNCDFAARPRARGASGAAKPRRRRRGRKESILRLIGV